MHPAIGCCPFCENYKKLYFNAKLLEKGLNRGAKMFGAFFFKKKCPFWLILDSGQIFLE